MKYSLSYKCSGWRDVDEVQCPYNQLGLIIHDVKPEQRVCILVSKGATIDKVIEQTDLVRKVVGDNYTIRCDSVNDLRQLLDRGYKAWLFTPVTDWETYQGLLSMGASDILLDSYLCFCGEDLEFMKRKHEIIHRVSPCLSPTQQMANINAPKSSFFFIRPEDQWVCEKAIDILSPLIASPEAEQYLIDIYKRGNYIGDLCNIITGLDIHVENALLYGDNSDFAKMRFRCRQKCQQPGYRCQFCENTLRVVEKSIAIVKEYINDRDANGTSQTPASDE